MGNSCACLGGGGIAGGAGKDYAVVHKRKPQVDTDGGSDGDVNMVPGGHGGSYRKTATAAKYSVPVSSTKTVSMPDSPTNSNSIINHNTADVNRNNAKHVLITDDNDELELNLNLQRISDVPANVSISNDMHVEKADLEPPEKIQVMPVVTKRALHNDTHQETFQAPSISANTSSIKQSMPADHSVATSATSTISPNVHSKSALDSVTSHAKPGDKTHTEVFHLNIATETDLCSQPDTDTGQSIPEPNTVHINLSHFLSDESPEREPIPSSAGPTSTETSSTEQPIKSNEDHLPVLSLHHYVSSEVPNELPVITFTSPTNSSANASRLDISQGINNEAFDISDEQQNPNVSSAMNNQQSIFHPTADVVNVSSGDMKPEYQVTVDQPETAQILSVTKQQHVDSSGTGTAIPQNHNIYEKTRMDLDAESGRQNSDIIDDKYFFFGMEQHRFQHGNDGVEADREIGEIMAELETIDETIWVNLRPPDETDSGNTPGYHLADQSADNNLYDSVLDQLVEVCKKVENILGRKAFGQSEFDEPWLLDLPDLTDLHKGDLQQIDKQYQKSTTSTQTDVTHKLLEAAGRGDRDQVMDILAKYKYQQERLLRIRQAERLRIKERLRHELDNRGHQMQTDDNVNREEDEDSEKIKQQYDLLLTAKEEDLADVISSDSSESSEYSDEDSDDFTNSSSSEDIITEVEVEATKTLKTTLTNDIKSRMMDMTGEDFRSIMNIYRKEHQGIRHVRQSERGKYEQSLWDKLAERRRHVDESIHEGNMDIPEETEINHDNEANKDMNLEQNLFAKDPVSMTHSQDVATETDLDRLLHLDAASMIHEKDFEKLNQDALMRSTQLLSSPKMVDKEEPTLDQSGVRGRAMDQLDVEGLLREHFDNVKLLRQQKEQKAQEHRQRLLERLRTNKQIQEADISSIETDMSTEDGHQNMEQASIEKDCLETLHQQGASINQQQLQAILQQYKQAHGKLEQNRIQQRAALDDRLQQKLMNRRPEPELVDSENKDNHAENQLQSLDDLFYQSLLARRAAGDLTEEQLAQLVEDHLNQVEQFTQKVKKHVERRRKEREESAVAAEVSALVEDDKHNREKVRHLRQEQRNKIDDKLHEKLRKRKQKKSDGDPGGYDRASKRDSHRRRSKQPLVSEL